MQIQKLVVGALQTNCYLVYDEVTRSAYIVDPGDEADEILDTVRAESLHVLAVVLTHVHFDHMLAADAVCRALRVPLYVGAGDQPALTDGYRNLMELFSPGATLMLLANKLLYEGDKLPLGEHSLSVLETPGHTPGSICLLTDEVLISGDTLFCGSAGRTDFPGGNSLSLYGSLAKLAALPGERRVYPGHGESTTLSYERTTNPFMTN